MTHVGCPSACGNGLFSDTRFNWQFDVRLPKPPGAISYKYVVQGEGSPPRIETGGLRYLAFDEAAGAANYEFNDIWRWDEIVQNMTMKRIFDETFSQRGLSCPLLSLPESNLIRCPFLAFSPVVTRARTLHIVGSIPELGQWNPRRGLALGITGDLEATGFVDVAKSAVPFEYKHVALGRNNIIQWEPNENRRATASKWDDQACPWVVVFDSWHLNLAGVAFHGAGVFVKLSGMRDGASVFTFASLAKLATWAGRVGFAALHFVGLIDTTGLQARNLELPVSGFAISPLYLDLSMYDCCPRDLDELTVLSEKIACLRTVWRQSHGLDDEIRQFVERNRWWLVGYERFCASLQSELPEDGYSRFVDFVQCLCYRQLDNTIQAAREQNVSIGVDLAFALHMQCAEALSQAETRLFRTDFQLGILSTPSNPIGKVLPAYPYEFNSAAQWFAKRLKHFEQLFDLIRLESTVNFFRQYIVPRSSIRGVFGHFDPSVVVTFGQLETWGLWDIDGYTQPYIREPILAELFGDDAGAVVDAFLAHRDGQIVFRPEFNTERSSMRARMHSGSGTWRVCCACSRRCF
jgi:4-alpha-glucanotransferase